MKLLIVGASGLIGNAVYQLAKEQGIDVVGTATTTCGGKFVSYIMGEDEPERLLNAVSIYGKVEDTFAILAAAITNSSRCYENQLNSYQVNVQGVCKLAETFYEHNLRMVFLSSDAVFDGVTGRYEETDSPNPICVYGRQKAEAEQRLLNKIPDILIYRLGKQVDCFSSSKSLFTDLYCQYEREKVIRCIRGLIFNPTYLYDTANCILAGLARGLEGVFHVANPEVYSRFDIAKMLFKRMKIDVNILEEAIEEFGLKEPRPLNTSMKIDKFQSAMTYPFQRVEAVMRKYVDDFKLRD